MYNCLILGFGRSGTSLLGGILHHSGYYVGSHLHPPRFSNPEGFFEDIVINRINELILEPYDYFKLSSTFPEFSKPFSPYVPNKGHRWLTFIIQGAKIQCSDTEIIQKIDTAIRLKSPFAFKDPRFNYTLPVWLRFLPKNTKFICIFRNPVAVIKSVIKECNTMDYLKDFYVDEELVFKLWYNSYAQLLYTTKSEGYKNILFVSYEDLLGGKSLNLISSHLNAIINESFIQPKYNRHTSEGKMPQYVKELFDALNQLTRNNM